MNANILSKIYFLLLASVVLLVPLRASTAASFVDSEVKHFGYPAWFKDTPFFELEEDLTKARSDGKHGLMLLLTSQGCSYCDVFIRKSLGDPEIASMVRKHFDSVGMDIFNDADIVDPGGKQMSVKEFARRERAEFSPTLLFYGKDGKRMLRITGYQSPERFKKILGYVTGQHYRSGSLGEYLNRLPISKAAHAGIRPKHKRSLVLSRNLLPTSKPLLLIFEKTGCGECDDFRNDVLRLKRVNNTLKQFEVVSLDAMDDKTDIITPDGIRTTASSLFRNYAFSRMPAIAFFDVNGNAVLKTDSLVLSQRMMNSLNFVLEKAYKKGLTYQKFERTKAIESFQKKQKLKQ